MKTAKGFLQKLHLKYRHHLVDGKIRMGADDFSFYEGETLATPFYYLYRTPPERAFTYLPEGAERWFEITGTEHELFPELAGKDWVRCSWNNGRPLENKEPFRVTLTAFTKEEAVREIERREKAAAKEG